MTLDLQPHFFDPDERAFFAHTAGDAFYAALTEAHRSLSDDASNLLNAKLVLILANHIGDLGVIREAIAVARR